MSGLRLLTLFFVLISVVGCTVPPSPPGGPPVVDRSSLYRPPPPAPAPPVEVNPLPRSEPLRSQQFPPQQPSRPVVATPPEEPEDPFANRAVPQQPPATTAAAPSPPPAATPPPAAELSQASGPIVGLLDDAQSHVNNQNWDRAAASLERALRIEPRNASIWHDLAQVRLQQRDYQQAENLAQKSNSLAGDNGVQARNWDLIAFSRRAQGDNNGADEAEARASVLRR